MSTTINIFERYEEFDLDDKVVCNKVANMIDINSNKNVELDISQCLIGYDATCVIIDKVISDMLQLEGNKSLTVITDYQFPEEIITSFLFRGSRFVSKELEGKLITLDSLANELKRSLSGHAMSIHISIDGKTSQVL